MDHLRGTKLHFPWRNVGIASLIIIVIALAWLTVHFSILYHNKHQILEQEKARIAEEMSAKSARILNDIVGEIQQQTDQVAKQISQHNLSSLSAESASTIDKLAHNLASANIVIRGQSPF